MSPKPNEFDLLRFQGQDYSHRKPWVRNNSPEKLKKFWRDVGIDLFIAIPYQIQKRWLITGYIPTLEEVLHVITRRYKVHGIRPLYKFVRQSPKDLKKRRLRMRKNYRQTRRNYFGE
jgi:hypothetical protein